MVTVLLPCDVSPGNIESGIKVWTSGWNGLNSRSKHACADHLINDVPIQREVQGLPNPLIAPRACRRRSVVEVVSDAHEAQTLCHYKAQIAIAFYRSNVG